MSQKDGASCPEGLCPVCRIEQLEAALREAEEALRQNEVDARWIVGQWQRLKDEPVKEVATDIVHRVGEALSATTRALSGLGDAGK